MLLNLSIQFLVPRACACEPPEGPPETRAHVRRDLKIGALLEAYRQSLIAFDVRTAEIKAANESEARTHAERLVEWALDFADGPIAAEDWEIIYADCWPDAY